MRSDGKCTFRGVKVHLFVYMKRDTFTLNYMEIDSSGGDRVFRTEQVVYRDDVDLDFVPASEGHEGDRFSGWYRSPALAGAGNPLTAMTMPPEDINLYAGWNPVQRSVEFDTCGGTAAPEPQTVTDKEKAQAPETPQREGYRFAGWFLTPGETDVRKSWDFEQPVEKDLVLYAGWYPAGETAFTVRHIIEGEEEPFYEETGKGGFGDTVFIRSLETEDEGYPAGMKLESGFEDRKVTLQKEPGDNVFTVDYRKRDEVTGGGEEGETGDTTGDGEAGESGGEDGGNADVGNSEVNGKEPEGGSGGTEEREPGRETEDAVAEEDELAVVPDTGDAGSMIGVLVLAVTAAVIAIVAKAAVARTADMRK